MIVRLTRGRTRELQQSSDVTSTAFSGLLNIQDGITEIGENAYEGRSGLERLSIPFSLEFIGRGAFFDCHNLCHVQFHRASRLREISHFAFNGCLALKTVDIPGTVEIIGERAFAKCTLLTEIILREGLKSLGNLAFELCTSLSRACIPSTVEYIGHGTFWRCYSLIEVEIKNGPYCIDSWAFQDCYSLSAISIPASVESIGEEAFAGCEDLLGVEILTSEVLDIDVQAFAGCLNLVNIDFGRLEQGLIDREAFDDCPMLNTCPPNANPLTLVCNRFANLPVHRACYRASTTRIVYLESILSNENGTDQSNWKDAYGMTPFHIVATSANLRTDLLEVLLDHYPLAILSEKGSHEQTMMDYLRRNSIPSAFDLIRMLIRKTLFQRIIAWGVDVSISYNSMWLDFDVWATHEEARIKLVKRAIAFSEVEEILGVTSLLELAMWKKSLGTLQSLRKRKRGDQRERCHLTSGSSVVIRNVMPFLWGHQGQRALGDIGLSMFDENISWLKTVNNQGE